MSRSVAYPSNAEFTLYMEGPYSDDPIFAQDDWIDWKEWLAERLEQDFPSLSECNEWEGNECHAFLENNFGKFYLASYGSLVSLSFKLDDLTENVYYGGSDTTGLGQKWARQAEAKLRGNMKSFLFNSIGTASNGEQFFEKAA
jgi:hypothetical protein